MGNQSGRLSGRRRQDALAQICPCSKSLDFSKTSRGWPPFGTLSACATSGSPCTEKAWRETRTTVSDSTHRSPKGAPMGSGKMSRMAMVFSQDESIIGLIRDGLGDGWRIDLRSGPGEARVFPIKTEVGIVVIDDAAIEEPTRGWLLDQVHRWAPDALVAYIASAHAPEVERRVRSRGVQYYLSRPVDRERTLRVLRSFVLAVEHRRERPRRWF